MHDDIFRHRGLERDHIKIKHNPALEIARLLLRKKTLLIAILFAFAIILLSGIWIVGMLLPYLGQFLGQFLEVLDEKGIKGLLESLLPLIERIWEGSGK